MVEVECPVEQDCDFSGPVSSVEGHISGSTHGEHRGCQGREYRDLLTERAESVGEGPTLDVDQTATDATDGDDDGAATPLEEESDVAGVAGSDGTGEETSEQAENQSVDGGEAVESGVGPTTTSAAALGAATGLSAMGSSGADLPWGKIAVGAAVVVVVFLVIRSTSSEGGKADVAGSDESVEQADETEQHVTGGLVGA